MPDKVVEEKLKLIDTEISHAIGTINELEEKLKTIRTDETGIVERDDCLSLKEKFASFNKSVDELTRMLKDLGLIGEDELN